MNIAQLVRGFVVENFLFGDDRHLSEDESFLRSGIIDSTGVLELISYLEATFNIMVEDDEVIPENLDSLRSISNYIQAKQAGNGASACVR